MSQIKETPVYTIEVMFEQFKQHIPNMPNYNDEAPLSSHLFDKLIKLIEQVLQDTYSRFLASEIYKEMIEEAHTKGMVEFMDERYNIIPVATERRKSASTEKVFKSTLLSKPETDDIFHSLSRSKNRTTMMNNNNRATSAFTPIRSNMNMHSHRVMSILAKSNTRNNSASSSGKLKIQKYMTPTLVESLGKQFENFKTIPDGNEEVDQQLTPSDASADQQQQIKNIVQEVFTKIIKEHHDQSSLQFVDSNLEHSKSTKHVQVLVDKQSIAIEPSPISQQTEATIVTEPNHDVTIPKQVPKLLLQCNSLNVSPSQSPMHSPILKSPHLSDRGDAASARRRKNTMSASTMQRVKGSRVSSLLHKFEQLQNENVK
ncbi:hypothetical protein AKO1_005853 [Acrasis kona]|uniref:RGS domain-containing protein n=1 Tax=Acrasis kona TaxID=1008807 RepID=A0AAW2YJQ4_9EUKA